MMTTAADFFFVGALRIGAERIDELQDGRAIHSVRRADIRSIYLHYGFLARHPIIQLIFAAVLVLGFGMLTLMVISALMDNVAGKSLCMAPAFLLLGVWLIYDALKRGHYLEIWTHSRRHKLIVGRDISQPHLDALKELLKI
jgi:hypothetical protein